jgi:hypothetical protein
MFGRITLFCLALLANLMIGCESTGSSKSSSASASGANNAAYKKATSATYKTYAKARGPVRVLRTTAYHCHEEDHENKQGCLYFHLYCIRYRTFSTKI